MSDNFVKLYGSILDSSIWLESGPTRLVWITLLAMADEDGMVRAAVGGLAHRARVDKAECLTALETLAAPDPESKSPEFEGRRIEAVEGGWLILNARKYRERRSKRQVQVAERVRRHRDRKPQALRVTHVTPEGEGEGEAEVEEKTKDGELSLPVSLDEPAFREAWADWIAYRRERKLATWKGRTVKAKLAELESAGAVEAVKAIRASIANGWSGIFPKAAGAPVAARRPRASSIACPPAHPDDLAALEAIGERFEVSP